MLRKLRERINQEKGFTITAKSKSTTDFIIKKDDVTGKISRSCSNPSKGGCPSGGATNW